MVVAEARLDLAAEVIDDRLGLPRLDGVQRRSRHRGRFDLLDVQRGGEIGVDESDVDTDDPCALAPQLDPGGVAEAPGRRLRRRVRGEQRAADPGRDREDVDERAASVGGEHGGESLRHRDQAEVVDIELGAGALEARRSSALRDGRSRRC